jgi:hypothetical protein
VYRVPRALHEALTNRVKVMARLDIASRKPQDGRIRIQRGESEMDLRVSTLPTAFGDKVVVRVLDPAMFLKDLSELGLSRRRAAALRALVGEADGADSRVRSDGLGQDHDALLRAARGLVAGCEHHDDRRSDRGRVRRVQSSERQRQDRKRTSARRCDTFFGRTRT